MDLVHLQKAIALSLEDQEVKKDNSAEDEFTKALAGAHIYQPVFTLTQAGEKALAQQYRVGAIHVKGKFTSIYQPSTSPEGDCLVFR